MIIDSWDDLSSGPDASLGKEDSPLMLALLQGYDLLIVLGIIALLFGSSQLPKLARSLGSASGEFKKGTEEGGGSSPKEDLRKGAAKASADIKEAVGEIRQAEPVQAPPVVVQAPPVVVQSQPAPAQPAPAQPVAVQAQPTQTETETKAS